MRSRAKEEEKIENTLRSLLKFPDNRRCINCNSLGPQYVCTTFMTFICTNCSGIHREFSHRVKSVSMAKFSLEEVTALQAGGNERARQIYFKEWDPQCHSFPESNNLQRLRDFIKHVYIDRKYTGEKLARLKLVERGESSSKHSCNERSNPAELSGESKRYYYDERKSPRFPRENSRSGGFRRSPVRFEVVDDRVRDDKPGNAKRSDNCRSSNEGPVPGSSSPNFFAKADRFRSPVVRPVSDILGENSPALRVGDLSPTNEGKRSDSSAENQRNSLFDGDPIDERSGEQKGVNCASLIDFEVDLKSIVDLEVPKTQVPQHISDENWAFFASPRKEENTSVSLPSQLSAPSAIPADYMPEVSKVGNVSSSACISSMLPLPASDAFPADPLAPKQAVPDSGGTYGGALPLAVSRMTTTHYDSSGDFNAKVIAGQQYGTHAIDSGSSAQQSILSDVALNNQPWPSTLEPNAYEASISSTEQSSQSIMKLAQEVSRVGGSQPPPAEVKSDKRKELPEDLFTFNCSPAPAPAPGWRPMPHSLGFSPYYHTTEPVPFIPNSAKGSNPFDMNEGRRQDEGQMFPSMESLQGTLPNGPPPMTILHTSSLGTYLNRPADRHSEPTTPNTFSPVGRNPFS